MPCIALTCLRLLALIWACFRLRFMKILCLSWHVLGLSISVWVGLGMLSIASLHFRLASLEHECVACLVCIISMVWDHLPCYFSPFNMLICLPCMPLWSFESACCVLHVLAFVCAFMLGPFRCHLGVPWVLFRSALDLFWVPLALWGLVGLTLV